MTTTNPATNTRVLAADHVTISYATNKAVKDVSFAVREHSILAMIGPSGCGKSTLLRSFNRMNDFITTFKLEGKVSFRDKDIYSENVDPAALRTYIGMVFQKPNPFPSSIWKNVSWAPKIHGYKGNLDELVEVSLRKASLWDEVKDKLSSSGLALSGGQQQRLCIARAIAMDPEVILMDEPCSALDPISTAHIEELIIDLRTKYTIVIVTHNMQQAARLSDETAFMYQGELAEFGPTKQIFGSPKNKLTADYVSGRFG